MTEAIVKDFLTSFRDRDSDCLQGGGLGGSFGRCNGSTDWI